MYTPDLQPIADSLLWSALVAALPLLTVFIALGVLRWKAHWAGLSGLAAENIARGQGDATSVMKAWMNSPGHRANILNCEYRTLGVGMYDAVGGPWWTQDFGF